MDILEKARQYEDINRVSEKVRPLFHVTPPVGWVNDPNGFSVYQGKVHLFYQYHPYSTGWGPMHWGHQVTEDFVRWHECPAALAPDKSYDSEGCFSGSGIETDEGHVLVYTGVTKEKDGKGNIQNQCIAIGDGINYKKYQLILLFQEICFQKGLAVRISGTLKSGKRMVFIILLQETVMVTGKGRLYCLPVKICITGIIKGFWHIAEAMLGVCGNVQIFLDLMENMS